MGREQGYPLPGLRDARRCRLLSARELAAAAAGLSVGTVSRLENGHVCASLPTLRKLAAALKAKPAVLLGTANDTGGWVIGKLRHPMEHEPSVRRADPAEGEGQGVGR